MAIPCRFHVGQYNRFRVKGPGMSMKWLMRGGPDTAKMPYGVLRYRAEGLDISCADYFTSGWVTVRVTLWFRSRSAISPLMANGIR